MKFLIIILLILIQIINSINITPRSPRQELQEYLSSKNCKNRLLNTFVIKQIYKNSNYNHYYNYKNFNSLNLMIKTHYPHFLQKDILDCYDILVRYYMEIELKKNLIL
jgi:hypothetical protein